MQLSDLQTQVRFLSNTDSTSYTNDQINANLTRWAHLLTTEILDSQDEWDFQGEISTANLVANQREYVFPTDILKIKKVELKLDGTNWYQANVVNKSDISTPYNETDIIQNFTNDKPYVTFYNGSMFIWSGTISNVTDGIRIFYSEEVVGKDTDGADITSFSTATDKPNIAEAYQRGMILGATKDFAQKYQQWNLYRSAGNELTELIERMKKFYGDRIQDRRIILQTSSDSENYE